MAGVLYARVAGAWVPVSNGNPWNISPAYIGPRLDNMTDAMYSHVNAPSNVGFGVRAGSPGIMYANLYDGGTFYINQQTAAMVAQFKLNDHLISPWRLGFHPAASMYHGLWRNGYDSVNDYVLLARATETLINVPSGGSINFRHGNAGLLDLNSSGCYIGPPCTMNSSLTTQGGVVSNGGVTAASQTDVVATRRFYQNGPDTGFGTAWNQAHVVIAGAGYYGARVGFNYSGATGQFRLGQWKGNALEAVSGDQSVYIPMWASSHPVESTTKVKREVRSVYPERERIQVRRDPWSDTVDPPDVMSLRPVAFRPKGGAMRWNAETETHEPDDHPVWLHEGRRERLGLIAEEVETVIPSSVMHDQDGAAAGIDYAQITVALLAHVQQLTETVATLKYRITELENARG